MTLTHIFAYKLTNPEEKRPLLNLFDLFYVFKRVRRKLKGNLLKPKCSYLDSFLASTVFITRVTLEQMSDI